MPTKFWDNLVQEYTDFNGSPEDFLAQKGITLDVAEALVPSEIKKLFFENLRDELEEDRKKFIEEQVEEYLEYSQKTFEGLRGYLSRKLIDAAEFVRLMPKKAIDEVLSTAKDFFRFYETGKKEKKLYGLLKYWSCPEDAPLHPQKKQISWYDPSLKLKEMAEKANLSAERVRGILKDRGLFNAYKLIRKTTNSYNECLVAILSVPKPWSLQNLAVTTGFSERKILNTARKFDIDIGAKLGKGTCSKCLSKWYDASKTAGEMAEIANATENTVWTVLKELSLPYAKMKRNGLPSWYDSKKTAAEMSETSGFSRANIYTILRTKNLPFKRLKAVSKDIGVSLSWYSSDLSLTEMSYRSGFSVDAIRKFLIRHDLKYKRKRSSGNKKIQKTGV